MKSSATIFSDRCFCTERWNDYGSERNLNDVQVKPLVDRLGIRKLHSGDMSHA